MSKSESESESGKEATVSAYLDRQAQALREYTTVCLHRREYIYTFRLLGLLHIDLVQFVRLTPPVPRTPFHLSRP